LVDECHSIAHADIPVKNWQRHIRSCLRTCRRNYFTIGLFLFFCEVCKIIIFDI